MIKKSKLSPKIQFAHCRFAGRKECAMHRFLFVAPLLVSVFLLISCYTEHKVEVAPVKVEPIHITIDVNVKVDRALDDFFGDIDSAEEKLK